ncbi:hypothetical protein Drorol1_Dr00027208, partial [Drosera rotundifolia]
MEPPHFTTPNHHRPPPNFTTPLSTIHATYDHQEVISSTLSTRSESRSTYRRP